MRFIFWDIDGTLLTTGRAGIIAWERAVAEVFGRALDFSQMKTAGLTDTEIALTLAHAASPSSTPAHAGRVLRGYEAQLPDCLPLRAGRVLPGVVAILERLRGIESLHCCLLTGNTRAGAAAKLSYYGLAPYFENGAFADGCTDRIEIALHVQDIVAACGGGAGCDIFVIGDTPNDIRCAKAIDARAIAVATGEFSAAELGAHGAAVVLPELPDPERFLALLDATAQPMPAGS